MLWFHLTGVRILIGGEVNAIIEQAASSAMIGEAPRIVDRVDHENKICEIARVWHSARGISELS